MKKPKVEYQKAKIIPSKENISRDNPVIAWWSGGLDSAVTCYLCVKIFGIDNVRVIFIDTKNEDEDTDRFKVDCEKWYGLKIETITNSRYDCIQDVWYQNLSLNVATGAKCSSELKIVTRQQFIKKNRFSYQAFGFDSNEINRASNMLSKNSHLSPIFPIIEMGYSKQMCADVISKAEISLPRTYKFGFLNNNCFETGCVQGGVGYWQKMRQDFPDKFAAMAKVEHDLTNEKGEPVTMLKDQSKKSPGLVFLLPHPDYPHIKDISMMKGRPVKPLNDCNGFCGVGENKETMSEINYQD